MNVEELREYCLSLDADVEERFPFSAFKYAKDVLVFYIGGHMFCYYDINDLSSVTVKCDAKRISELTEQYDWIGKPYNGNARYWIGMDAYRADDTMMKQLVEDSYQLVRQKTSRVRKGVRMEALEMKFSEVFPMLIEKAARKGRPADDVYAVTVWLTGYTALELDKLLRSDSTYGEFIAKAPLLNPAWMKVRGKICGVSIEGIENQHMRTVRVLDKLVDELAKGKSVEMITEKYEHQDSTAR